MAVRKLLFLFMLFVTPAFAQFDNRINPDAALANDCIVNVGGAWVPASCLALDRHWGWCFPLNSAATTWTAVGMTAPNTAGTSAIYAAVPLSGRMMISSQTKVGTPTSGDVAGWAGPFTETRLNFLPKFSAVIKTDATITSERVWVGLSSATLAATAGNTTNAAIAAAAFSYDTGVDTHWHFVTCIGSGAANSCTATDTGITVTTSNIYTITIDNITSSSTLVATITPVAAATVKISTSSNLPTATTDMGIQATVTTLTNAQRLMNWGRIGLSGAD